jgi:Flp pilus assembly protein TadG
MIRDEKGQSMIEFAVILPLLLLLLCGMFDFGRLMYAYMQMNNAAQETVRLGGLGKTDSQIIVFAKNFVTLGDPSQLKVTISPVDTARHSGDYVTVKLEFPFTYMTPVISKIIPNPIVKAKSTIRVE